ncbi:MAG TPA: PTS lactose/cellobiose transporter subunit IIA [Tetragenococcus sp.]|nr:PTS lactose/cellobiose transporter subunit IIA [Tetragenococcus sp.]
MEEKNLQASMGLIMHAGDAKSSAMEAIAAAKKGNFDEARKKLTSADEALKQAHLSQTNLLTEEAQGNHTEITLLGLHAQDHLMTALTFNDLAKEIVDLYQRLEVG